MMKASCICLVAAAHIAAYLVVFGVILFSFRFAFIRTEESPKTVASEPSHACSPTSLSHHAAHVSSPFLETPQKLFNKEDLATFDGQQQPRMYLAILGDVFDVSKGTAFYGASVLSTRCGLFSAHSCCLALFVNTQAKARAILSSWAGTHLEPLSRVRSWEW